MTTSELTDLVTTLEAERDWTDLRVKHAAILDRTPRRKERPAMSEAKFLIGIATAVHPDAYEIERRARG